ncbi:MAG TPA: DUF4249 domain-containing protein [Flavisolibacter sp.]|jgi:hypothetical protein|nr:DUF4249 domain-containing protein [Flavisolibacter sp.]
MLPYLLVIGFALYGCKQVYEPPAIKATHNYLVVEGIINGTNDSRTEIRLSRTRNLTDTFLVQAELGARITIQGKNGSSYLLQEAANGLYATDHLALDQNGLYRLEIVTADGTRFSSQYVPVKQTPPVDSLTWTQDKDVSIYVATHDPGNKSIYYQWDFEETFEYTATYKTILGVKDGLIFFRDTTNQIYTCWKTEHSTDLNLASSLNLSEDRISHHQVQVIPQNSDKIGIRYSILVRQYALTEEAYRYFQVLQKNTQQLGTLFDAQPSQLKSNIINESNTSEPVIGYVSAATIQNKRLFIENGNLSNWLPLPNEQFCKQEIIPQDPDNFLIYKNPDTSFAPWYFVTAGSGIVINKRSCLDCTLKGGVNQRPSYW